jgi:hypothetical protein
MAYFNASYRALIPFWYTNIDTTAHSGHHKNTIFFLIGLNYQSTLSYYYALQINAFCYFDNIVVSGNIDGCLDGFVGAESGVNEQSQRFGGQGNGILFLGKRGGERGKLRFRKRRRFASLFGNVRIGDRLGKTGLSLGVNGLGLLAQRLLLNDFIQRLFFHSSY